MGFVKPLIDETLKELNINFNDLERSSHTKIMVKCQTCLEVFQRERRRLSEYHDCPKHLYRDGVFFKRCEKCLNYETSDNFKENTSYLDNLEDQCNNCFGIPSYLHTPASRNVRIEFQKDHPDAKLPFRKRTTDAGYDLSSVDDIIIEPNQVLNINTGLRISPPEGWYLTIDGRSSLFKEGIVPFRGIIDSNYTGILSVSLYNSSDKPFKVNKGDRIAQFTVHKIHPVDFIEVEDFGPEYSLSRGNQGWGSSGRK